MAEAGALDASPGGSVDLSSGASLSDLSSAEDTSDIYIPGINSDFSDVGDDDVSLSSAAASELLMPGESPGDAGDAGDTGSDIGSDMGSDTGSIDAISTPTSFEDSGEESEESSSEDPTLVNRIGAAIPDRDADVAGYDVWGRPVLNQAAGSAAGGNLDSFLLKQTDPREFYRTVTDDANGFVQKRLTDQQLQTLFNVVQGKPYNAQDIDRRENYTARMANRNIRRTALVKDVVGPRSRYTRIGEEGAINKMLQKSRDGKVDLDDPNGVRKRLEQRRAQLIQQYDVWRGAPDAGEGTEHLPSLLAQMPRESLPGHGLSYNPPLEFLNDEDLANYKPPALRTVRSSSAIVSDRFARCLDLFLSPRERKRQDRVDPETLLPILPNKSLLRPFPASCDLVIRTSSHLRSVSVSPLGHFLASGGSDGLLSIYEVLSGRLVRAIPILSVRRLGTSLGLARAEITCVRWCPRIDVSVIAVAAANELVFVDPGVYETGNFTQVRATTRKLLAVRPADVQTAPYIEWETQEGIAHFRGGYQQEEAAEAREGRAGEDEAGMGVGTEILPPGPAEEGSEQDEAEGYQRYSGVHYQLDHDGKVDPDLYSVYTRFNNNVLLRIRHPHALNHCDWHIKGDYIICTSESMATRASIAVHQLSRRRSSCPFRKISAKIISASFAVDTASVVIITEHSARVYALQEAALQQRLLPSVGDIVSGATGFDGHVVVAGFGARVALFRHGAGPDPTGKIRFHTAMVRAVSLHNLTGLVATGADDGLIQISRIIDEGFRRRDPQLYKTCSGKLMPCAVLRGHAAAGGGIPGITGLCWHPTQPWLVSCADDGTIRIWK